MPITFPRELPDVGYVTADFLLRDAVTASPAGKGLINYTDVAPPVWEASLTTRPLVMSQYAAVEAWWMSLRSGLRNMLFRHPHVCYPRNHVNDPAPALVAGRLASVSSGNVLAVDGVDAALSLVAGDRIGLEYGNRWYVGRVTDVSGSGAARTLIVEPPPPSNIAKVGAVVRFVRPGLLMRPVPDSFQAPRNGRFYTVSFKLTEVPGAGSVPRDMYWDFRSATAISGFSRASSATYWGADGLLKTAAAGEPRIEYDPVTHEWWGLLIEEPRTNLLFPSVPNAQWGTAAAAALTLNSGIAPDGSNTAATFGNANAALTSQYIFRGQNTSSYVAGTRYTAAFWVKALPGVTCPKIRVALHESAFGNARSAVFDPSNPSAGVQSINSPEAFGVEKGGNGWYCVWVSHTATATLNTWAPLLFWATQSNNADAALLVWHCQLEIGAFPTSPILTTTAAATRAADELRISGADFSSWYNPAEGTIFAEYAYNQPLNNGCVVSLDNGTSAEAAVIASTTTADRFIVTAGGVAQFNSGFVNYTPRIFGKRAGSWRPGEFSSIKDGGAVTTAAITVPQPTQLCIGHAGYFSSSRINGHIKRVAYIARRLSNAELVSLTS